MISAVDPQARHTRKSKSTRKDGFRGHVSAEPETGLITDTELTSAAGEDGSDPVVGQPMIARDRFHRPETQTPQPDTRGDAAPADEPAADQPGGDEPVAEPPAADTGDSAQITTAGTDSADATAVAGEKDAGLRVYGDSAYGTGAARAAYRDAGHQTVIKPKPLRPAVPGGFTLDDPTIDEPAGTVTCPAGHTRPRARTDVTFGRLCVNCPLRQARSFFETLVADNLDIGRPELIELVFKRGERRGAKAGGQYKTKIVTYGTEVNVNAFYRHSRIKQYLKDGRALRIETVINDPEDLGCRRRLQHLDELQTRARAVNTTLLDTERVGQGCVLASPAFERIAQPTLTEDGRRAPALRFGDPRVQALAGALCTSVLAVTGITNKSLRALMTGLLGGANYTMNQASYDLARLRNGLITRIPGRNRYRLTGDGLRFAIFYTKMHDRLLRPLLAADRPPAPPRSERPCTPSTFTSQKQSTGPPAAKGSLKLRQLSQFSRPSSLVVCPTNNWQSLGMISGMSKPVPALTVTDGQREVLKSLARSQSGAHREVVRAKALLMAADGAANATIAATLSVSRTTVANWRTRFAEDGLVKFGQVREGRGRKPSIPDATVEKIVTLTKQCRPEGETHWSTRTMAGVAGVSKSTVQRVWAELGLKPHRVDTFKVSNDPKFEEKLVDVVGLYLNPPENAIVLCADEKSSVQALDRTQASLPMTKGRGETMTHDYKRNGTTTLFAALNVLTGMVIGQCLPRHRHQEFLKFLRTIDREVPTGLQVHLILDNYGTHKHADVQHWLDKHPRFHLHFTPTSSSWLNQVERWFRELTDKALRRGAFGSVPDLIAAIQEYIDAHNKDPKPYVWTATAESILAKVARARATLDTVN